MLMMGQRKERLVAKSKRLFPKRMQANFINASQGIDRHAHGELYTEHVGSMKRGESLGHTTLDESVVNTPRGLADLKAYAERHATASVVTLAVAERLAFIKRMNSFRVAGNLFLHFRGQEWVFLKTGSQEIFSVVYKSKAEALQAYDRQKIFWA